MAVRSEIVSEWESAPEEARLSCITLTQRGSVCVCVCYTDSAGSVCVFVYYTDSAGCVCVYYTDSAGCVCVYYTDSAGCVCVCVLH